MGADALAGESGPGVEACQGQRWKEWKTTAARRHNLRIRGISESSARKWARQQQGILAGLRVQDPPGVAAQLLLGPPWPEDIEPDLAASQSDGLTNRRMRARMSGGVGGGGATPPPTRSRLPGLPVMRDDDDRACGVMDDLAAHRAHHEPTETAAATRADHDQVGVMGRIDEFLGRKAIHRVHIY